ncbi:hypothetical protein LguiA_005140 [Lonicera macranthoides]
MFMIYSYLLCLFVLVGFSFSTLSLPTAASSSASKGDYDDFIKSISITFKMFNSFVCKIFNSFVVLWYI